MITEESVPVKKLLPCILALAFLIASTPAAKAAEQLTAGINISFTLSDKNVSLITDGNVNTYNAFPKGEDIKISCGDAKALTLKWYKPAVYDIILFDANKSIIDFSHYNNDIVNQYIPLNGATSLDVNLPSGGELSDILFYSEGEPSPDTQVWNESFKKADMLVIAAHPDDEYLYMGGTIPYYGVAHGLHVVVAYMTCESRLRQDEALSSLWAIGIRNYPVFVGFPDKFSKFYANEMRYWGGEEAVFGAMVELYRKYKPEVVITHDLKGEYGHAAHMVTAAMAQKATTAAVDPSQFPESATEMGVWQIMKLYLHLYNENIIIMDWNQPLNAYSGKTALDMAKVGYSCDKSQLKYHRQVSDTNKYSCALFGLAYTSVGPDISKNDFLENIPHKCLSNDTVSNILSSPVQIPEPTSAPLQAPVVKTTSEPKQDIQSTPKLTHNLSIGWQTDTFIIFCILFVLIATLFLIALFRRGHKSRKRLD